MNPIAKKAITAALDLTSFRSSMLLILAVVVTLTNAPPPMPAPSYATVAEDVPDLAGTSTGRVGSP